MAQVHRELRQPKAPPGRSPAPLARDGVPHLDAIAPRTMITVEEAAALLGIGRSAAYEAARRGQLPTRRLGRRLFVPVPAFLEWLGATSLSERGKHLQV